MFASGASPRVRQLSFTIICMATPLAYEIVTFPLYASQISVAIIIVLEGFVEFGKTSALKYNSCFHGAKVIRIFENSAV